MVSRCPKLVLQDPKATKYPNKIGNQYDATTSPGPNANSVTRSQSTRRIKNLGPKLSNEDTIQTTTDNALPENLSTLKTAENFQNNLLTKHTTVDIMNEKLKYISTTPVSATLSISFIQNQSMERAFSDFSASFGLLTPASSNDFYTKSNTKETVKIFEDVLRFGGVDVKAYTEESKKCENKEDGLHWNYTQPILDEHAVIYKNQYCAQCFLQINKLV